MSYFLKLNLKTKKTEQFQSDQHFEKNHGHWAVIIFCNQNYRMPDVTTAFTSNVIFNSADASTQSAQSQYLFDITESREYAKGDIVSISGDTPTSYLVYFIESRINVPSGR